MTNYFSGYRKQLGSRGKKTKLFFFHLQKLRYSQRLKWQIYEKKTQYFSVIIKSEICKKKLRDSLKLKLNQKNSQTLEVSQGCPGRIILRTHTI